MALTWVVIIGFAIVSVVGLAVRTLTRRSVEFAFERRLEEVRHQHALELQRVKADYDKELELIKGEIELGNTVMVSEKEFERTAMRKTIAERAVFYPQLVARLRYLKLRLEYLHAGTGGQEGTTAVDLSKDGEVANLARSALKEILGLCDEYNELISKVRLFTNRSQYDLPFFARQFAEQWLSGSRGTMFSISDTELRVGISAYSDDVAYLAAEFYESPYSNRTTRDSPSFELSLAQHAYPGSEFARQWYRRRQSPTSDEEE